MPGCPSRLRGWELANSDRPIFTFCLKCERDAQLDFANEHVCGCVPAGQSADWLAVDVLGRLSHEHGVVLSRLGKGKGTVGAGAVGTIRWRSVVHSVYALNGLARALSECTRLAIAVWPWVNKQELDAAENCSFFEVLGRSCGLCPRIADSHCQCSYMSVVH